MNSDNVDAGTKEELRQFEKDSAAVREMFGSELTFGTGGLRGIIGAGLNRMNIYTVRRATQGLSDFINKTAPTHKPKSVAVAYDTRRFSREFAQETARVLAANKIKALLFAGARPTPQLSFAVRKLKCDAGIVITASHNPAEYNGYKVYSPDGGQGVPSFTGGIAKAMGAIDIFDDVRTISEDEARAQGLLEIVSPQLDRLYVERVCSLSLSRPQQMLKVVFSPLHGTGACFIPDILNNAHCIDLTLVEPQMVDDPDFPTVKSPNPENAEAFSMALRVARLKKADLAMATDPDCDRLGCAVRDKDGNYRLLTGNQIGALLLKYILHRLKEKNKLSENGTILKTIVTSDLGKMIAASYGIRTIETLTGFKYIGEKIKEFEAAGSPEFIFGYEESYGYLAGTFVRDKDANIAALLTAEMAAYYKGHGQTLLQVLESIYKRFGYYKEELLSLELDEKTAVERLMSALDRCPPEIAGMQITEKKDYSRSEGWNMPDNRAFKLTLPRSEVLYYRFNDGSWFCVRPSGTEPKIKLYFSAVGTDYEEVKSKLSNLKKAVLHHTQN